jgi:flagellar hook-associated protein 1 FlgK
LSSFQAAIDITGSNISNVNTPGYSRQRPVFSSVGSIDVRAAKIKVGVEVSDVERIYNNFLRDQINERSSVTGYYEALSTSLESVEIIFDETIGNGLNNY